MLRRDEEALEKFKVAIKLDPDHAPTINNFAFTLFRFGKTEEAIKLCKKAIKLSPEYPYPWFTWSACLEKLGKKEEAGEKLMKAQELGMGMVMRSGNEISI